MILCRQLSLITVLDFVRLVFRVMMLHEVQFQLLLEGKSIATENLFLKDQNSLAKWWEWIRRTHTLERRLIRNKGKFIFSFEFIVFWILVILLIMA